MGGGAYVWNELSVSTCGGLIHGGGLIFGGGAYIRGGAYSRRFTVSADNNPHWVAIGISFYKSDIFSFVYNYVFQCGHDTAQLIFP